jgi:hypothetical protein
VNGITEGVSDWGSVRDISPILPNVALCRRAFTHSSVVIVDACTYNYTTHQHGMSMHTSNDTKLTDSHSV